MSLVEEQLNIIDKVNEIVNDIEIYKDLYENPKLTKAQQIYNKGFLINVFKNRMKCCNPKEYKEYIKIFVNLFVLNNDIITEDNYHDRFYNKIAYGYIVIDKLTNIELCEIHSNTDNLPYLDKVNDNELRIEYMMKFYNDGSYYRYQKATKYSFKLRISRFNEYDKFKGIKELKNKIITYKSIYNYQSFTFERLTEILENDDVDSLIKMLSQPTSNIIDKFVVHIRNQCDNEKYIDLIELIVVYGAVKCFKYILLNKYLDEYINSYNERALMQFIIISNNYEILHLLENNYTLHTNWYDIINTVIFYHRNEFLLYMLNNKYPNQEIFKHNSIDYIFDYCLSSYNYKALLMLLNETEEFKPITKSIMKRDKYKYAVPLSVYVLDNYKFSLFTYLSYIVEFLFDGTYELDFIKRVLYSVEIKDINMLEHKNYTESFIKAFSACIINDLPDDYIKLLKSVYYGKEFLTIKELNDIDFICVILKEILNRKPKITYINYNKFITHIVPEIVEYDPFQLRNILNITNQTKNFDVKGLDEIVEEYIRRIVI